MRNTQCFSKKISPVKRFGNTPEGFESLRKRFGNTPEGFKSLRKRFGNTPEGFESLRKRFGCISKGYGASKKRFAGYTSRKFGKPLHESNKTLCLQNLAFPKHSSYICGQIKTIH